MRLNATKFFTSAGLLVGMALAVASAVQASTQNLFIPPANLTAWWRFDESSGQAMATNNSGLTNFPLTLAGGATYARGCTNRALLVNGSATFADGAGSPSGNDPSIDFGTANFTIRATVRTSSAGVTIPIVDHRVIAPDITHPRGYILFITDTGKLALQLGDGQATLNFISPSPTLTDGECHCVVATIDRTSPGTTGGHLYVDGVLVLTFDPKARPGTVSNTGPFRVGQECPGFITRAFDGNIDEVQIYSRALTLVQADSICLACAPHPSNLVHWWPLDETGGSSAVDNVTVYSSGTYQSADTHPVGQVNGSVGLASTSAFVTAPYSHQAFYTNHNSDFSVDAWVRVVNTSGLRTIVDHRAFNHWNRRPIGYSLYIFNGQLGMQLGDGSAVVGTGEGYNNYTSTSLLGVINPGQWTFVTATIERGGGATGGHLYVNGQLAHTFPSNQRQNNLYAGSSLIGQSQDPIFTSLGFNGDIDEVEVYSKALSQSEIDGLFNFGLTGGGKCPTPAAVPGVDRNGMVVMSLLLLLSGGYAVLRRRGQGNLSA